MTPSKAGIAYSYSGGATEGEAPPLFLIHGSGGDRLHWPPQLRRLESVPVYALDLPGHGKSPGEGERSIRAYVDHILHWMTALELPPAVWCGHSMGGAIAMTAALESSAQVAGLVLVGTGARLRVSPDILEITGDPDRFQEAAELVTRWAFNPSASPRLIELGRERYGGGRPEVMHGDFSACDAFDSMERLSEIRCPTLILCGEDDQLTPVKYSHFLQDHIADARLVTIHEAGHMVMLEKPEVVANEIRNFLTIIRAA